MAGKIPASFAQQFTMGGVTASVNSSTTAPGSAPYAGVIAANVTNQIIDIQFKHADVLWYLLQSDQAITLDVNSTSTPTPQIVLAANVPVIFLNNGTSLFTADVTAIYATTGAIPASANLYILVLLNSSAS